MQDRIIATIDDFQTQVDVIAKYDWDFDHYLEEDVPAAVRCHLLIIIWFGIWKMICYTEL